MFDMAQIAVEVADKYGADFGDIRIIRTESQHIKFKNGAPAGFSKDESAGFGIRILYKGAWGFASGDLLKASEIKRMAILAVRIAKAGSAVAGKKVSLAPEPTYRDFWQTPYEEDPFNVPDEEKMEILGGANRILFKNSRIKSAVSVMNFLREHQWHMTTEGSRIEQVLLASGAQCFATAVDGNEVQTRSYPSSHGGKTAGGGFEVIRNLNLKSNSERIREEALALLKARECPVGEMDLVIGGDQLALQIHESVGHASELDRVLGYEESYAGSSFATLEKLGKFRYASPIVNLVADATLPGGLATAGYDDDGVRAQRWHIIKDGILNGYMTSREFCRQAGFKRSFGSCRADGYSSIPIVRICNLSLMPGKHEYDEMISGIRNGIIMENNKSWSIDQRRLNFQFGCEIGWLVKNGKIKGMVKNPVYQGITPSFWNSCDAICNEKHWKLWSVTNCGKGQPPQTAMMTHANSPARFRKVKVGIH